MYSQTKCESYGWLDSIAISISMICAIHCLLTPILIASLPIISTTFWVHEDFHLWMILFVVPTTSVAVFMGCRKHKDKAVFALSALGLGILVALTIHESFFNSNLAFAEPAHCPNCAPENTSSALSMNTVTNVLGGILLASAHVRNYILCRTSKCH